MPFETSALAASDSCCAPVISASSFSVAFSLLTASSESRGCPGTNWKALSLDLVSEVAGIGGFGGAVLLLVSFKGALL